MKATNKTNAEKLTLNFYQTETSYKVSFETEKELTQSVLIGTALNELFTVRDNYAMAGLKLFKSNEPILFSVSRKETVIIEDKETEKDKTIFDLNAIKVQKTLFNSLKLNKTAKSKRAFAKRVSVAIIEIMRNVEVIDLRELETKLNAIVD